MNRRLETRVLSLMLALALTAVLAPAANATVSVSRAELKDTELRLEGRAVANRTITVDSVSMGTSDGSGSFRIERDPYSRPADCTIDVNDGSATATNARLSSCTVTSAPPTLTLSSLGLSPTSVVGGSSSTATLRLTSAAPSGGQTVTLSSSNPSIAAVPASVAVPAGSTSATFAITTNSVIANSSATITATAGGVTRTSVLTVTAGATAAPTPSTFVIDDRPLPDGNVGTDYNNFVTATGGNGTPFSWSIAAGALPDGLAIRDFASASGHIFGRPTRAQTSTFTVRATDQAGNSTTRQFTITVNPPRPLVITSPIQLPAGTVGAPYAVGVFADGGTTPYSWTRIGGALPPGLSLQASPGRIQGTPTTAGTYNFTLRVGDSGGQSATGTFSITINEPAPPPTPPDTPTLVSPANGASVVTPFTISWAAVSGASAYNWQVSTVPNFATTAAVGSTAGTNAQATVNNLANGTYFWRVQAANAQFGAGEYSAARSFTITGTTSPPVLAGISVNPGSVTGGSSATGTVFTLLPAPPGGATIGLSNGAPAVAAVPASVTVPAGQTSATFTVTTQPVTSSFTAVITATLGGDSRFAFLSVHPPSSLPPPATDSVSIQRADYTVSDRRLSVEARSTNGSATLRVFNTATGVQIGTLSNRGGGRYRSTFNVSTNPQNITVRSSLGGSASRNVTVR